MHPEPVYARRARWHAGAACLATCRRIHPRARPTASAPPVEQDACSRRSMDEERHSAVTANGTRSSVGAIAVTKSITVISKTSHFEADNKVNAVRELRR